MAMPRNHAVVIGGGLAGLLAARVLAGPFDRVTVVERDRFPGTPTHRPGVPQAHHAHALWGTAVLEKLFPGFGAEMRAAGATEVRMPQDAMWLSPAGWFPRFDAARLLVGDRSLLDWTVRKRLPPGIELLTGHDVTGLVARGNSVSGVEIRERVAGSGSEQVLEADLVVDAGGRSSRTPQWLEALGYPTVQETRVDPLVGYASRQYAIPSGFDADWKALFIHTAPPAAKRMGILFPLGGGRWICSLSGAGGDYPPTEDEAFLDFAKSLRSPLLYESIRDARPLTPIVGFRHTANRRRHYERMPRWPERFVVVGDAACTLDPVYGQGMTVAAFHAVALDEWLRGRGGRADGDACAQAFQRRAARAAGGAWMIATGADQCFPTTVGPPVQPHTRFINWYMSRLTAAATVDETLCARIFDVFAFRGEPSTLFRPATLARLIAVSTRGPRRVNLNHERPAAATPSR